MFNPDKADLIGLLVAASIISSATGLAAPAVHIDGQVQSGDGAVANSTVTLWAGSVGEPRQLAQAKTADDGSFALNADATPEPSASLYLVAKGGVASVNKSAGDNPALAFLAVLGGSAPANVTVNEMTTVASVWTNAQFLDGAALKGPALSLNIAAGNVPNFVDLSTGGWGENIQDPLNSGQTPTMANFATLADALAGCATRVTPTACEMLFQAAKTPRGDAPADTLAAAGAVARAPWYLPSRLFGLLDFSIRSRRAKTCARFRSCRISTPRQAPGCCRSSSTAAAIAPAARRRSTVRATSGSATISPSAGRRRTRCGKATRPSSRQTAVRSRRSPRVFPAAAWRAAPSGGGRRQ